MLFDKVHNYLKSVGEEEKKELFLGVKSRNPWFTDRNLAIAWEGILHLTNPDNTKSWLKPYDLPSGSDKTIGIVAAGNIPAVGFHDVMSCVACGADVHIKLSSQDTVFMTYLIELINKYSDDQPVKIIERMQLDEIDGVIATGSDNSSRYFDYYFRDKPSIIRKNRTSIAILNGEENENDITALGEDIFIHFGLGCRNVSHLWIPEGYDIPRFLDQMEQFNYVADHHKYFNNYEYNKAIYLVNGDKHYDNGFLILKPDEKLVSPIAVLYYTLYKAAAEVTDYILEHESKLQCVVGNLEVCNTSYGKTQKPGPQDYADRVDTIQFVLDI